MGTTQPRDDSGEFTEQVTEQDILKVFDRSRDPFLSTSEIATELPIGTDAVRKRLQGMAEAGLVDRKKIGARAVGWWALVAPELDPAVAERLDAEEAGDGIPLDELRTELTG
jgi:repressor of nif and glnA expression